MLTMICEVQVLKCDFDMVKIYHCAKNEALIQTDSQTWQNITFLKARRRTPAEYNFIFNVCKHLWLPGALNKMHCTLTVELTSPFKIYISVYP